MAEGTFAMQVRELKDRMPNYCRSQAEKLSAMTVEHTKRHTPVGHRRDPRTGAELGPSGELRDSIEEIPVRQIGNDTWSGGAMSRLRYASYVELGTRAHVIEPRTGHWLHFFDGPEEVWAKRVHHPATYGKHMFRQGLDDAVREWRESGDKDLQELVTEVFR